MKTLKNFTAIVVLLACSPFVMADGNGLLAQCTEVERTLDKDAIGDMFEMGLCYGFVMGVAKTQKLYEQMGSKASCMPSMDSDQIVRVVLKFLRANPEKLHHEPEILIMLALTEAFPCKPK